jgi:DNA-binding response OmpR family regulator
VQQLQSPVILVVDDDPAMQNTLQQALVSAGYQVETAPDGATALARLERGGIDLVLLDRVLPDMDGLNLCAAVRAREAEDYLPIVMVTGLIAETDRHAGFAAGADDYIAKPFTLQELRDRVGAWTRTRGYLAHVRAQQREQVAQERAALAIAVETSHDLTRLLMLVLDLLQGWEGEAPSPEEASRLHDEFRDAATVLAARINLLRRSALRESSLG